LQRKSQNQQDYLMIYILTNHLKESVDLKIFKNY